MHVLGGRGMVNELLNRPVIWVENVVERESLGESLLSLDVSFDNTRFQCASPAHGRMSAL